MVSLSFQFSSSEISEDRCGAYRDIHRNHCLFWKQYLPCIINWLQIWRSSAQQCFGTPFDSSLDSGGISFMSLLLLLEWVGGIPKPTLWKNSGTLIPIKCIGLLNVTVDEFDARFFLEAVYMDPQPRLHHDLVWNSLEYSCIDPLSFYKSHTVMLAGSYKNDYKYIVHESTVGNF